MSANEGHEPQSHSSHGGHGGHGGGQHEEHEGAPEWLISFADNVTLMMGFFVIMLAFSLGPKGGGSGSDPDQTGGAAPASADMLDLALGIREAFNNPVDLNSMDPNDEPLVRRLLERRGLAQVQDDGPAGDRHLVQSLRPSNYSAPSGTVFFDSRSKQVDADGRQVVRDVAAHVRGLRLIVNVLGHVSAAEADGIDDHGMQLAFERAMAVGRALHEDGIEWNRIRITAVGDNDRAMQPVYDVEGHRANQRVEVSLMDELVRD